MPHRLVHEGAHGGDRLLGDGPALQPPAVVRLEPPLQFVPDRLVAPRPGVRPRGDLEVEPGDGRRPHGQQGEAAFVAGVDEFVVRGRDVGEDAEPGVGVRPLEHPGDPGREGMAGHPPEPVAADHVVALQHVLAPLVPEGNPRPVALRPLHAQRLGLEEQRSALLRVERDEVLADLGLGVDGHGPAAGERGEVDAVPAPVEPQLDPVVPQPLPVHPLPGPGGAQHVGRPLLQDPGPLPLLDVGPVPALQDDRLDPGAVQQPGEQQPGGPRPDDPDGGTHRSPPCPAAPRGVRLVNFLSPASGASLRPHGSRCQRSCGGRVVRGWFQRKPTAEGARSRT